MCKPNIEYLELFALAAGVLTWQEQLRDMQITVFCDNMAVVHMINNITSSSQNCMYLLHILVLNGLKFSRRLRAKYINTKYNFVSDALSRGQMTRFRRLGPHMNQYPDVINNEIWPVSRLWNISVT